MRPEGSSPSLNAWLLIATLVGCGGDRGPTLVETERWLTQELPHLASFTLEPTGTSLFPRITYHMDSVWIQNCAIGWRERAGPGYLVDTMPPFIIHINLSDLDTSRILVGKQKVTTAEDSLLWVVRFEAREGLIRSTLGQDADSMIFEHKREELRIRDSTSAERARRAFYRAATLCGATAAVF